MEANKNSCVARDECIKQIDARKDIFAKYNMENYSEFKGVLKNLSGKNLYLWNLIK